MDLVKYRQSEKEQLRVSSLMNLIPDNGENALDIGARDGFLSKKLINYFNKIIAVDLVLPDIDHEKVECQIGDITNLNFLDNSFDLVLCAEVLEHIPTKNLYIACNELSRVTKEYLIIGVPYKQDLRVGKTTCLSCYKTNPPWGHINTFDLPTLTNLFSGMKVEKAEYISSTEAKTNFIASFLMGLAGNPYGTYSQDELCIHCGMQLFSPPTMNLSKKIFAKLAVTIDNLQKAFVEEQANWIHVLFKKQ